MSVDLRANRLRRSSFLAKRFWRISAGTSSKARSSLTRNYHLHYCRADTGSALERSEKRFLTSFQIGSFISTQDVAFASRPFQRRISSRSRSSASTSRSAHLRVQCLTVTSAGKLRLSPHSTFWRKWNVHPFQIGSRSQAAGTDCIASFTPRWFLLVDHDGCCNSAHCCSTKPTAIGSGRNCTSRRVAAGTASIEQSWTLCWHVTPYEPSCLQNSISGAQSMSFCDMSRSCNKPRVILSPICNADVPR